MCLIDPHALQEMLKVTRSTQDVEAAIAYHDAETRRLTQILNYHSRAATLPASVLALIFVEQAAIFYERCLASWYGARTENLGEPSHKAIYSWVAVSHVCRSWREVALHCARMWTTIVLDERINVKFIQLLLDRSEGLPLTVVLHASVEEYHCPGCSAVDEHQCEENYRDALKILRSIFPRTRTLSVFLNKGECQEVWDALRGLRHASKLECLRLEATGSFRFLRSTDFPSNADVVVPNVISSSTPPRLSSLVICGVRLQWANQLLCSTVRRLHVTVCQFDKGTRLGTLLIVLRNMPRLEVLDLDEIPPVRRGIDHGRTALPHLRTLRIPLESKHTAPFLLSLDVPSTTSILLFRDRSNLAYRPTERGIAEDIQEVIVAATKQFLAKEIVYAISHDEEDGTATRFDSPPRTSIWTLSQSAAPVGNVLSWEAAVGQHPPRIAYSARLDSKLVTKLLGALDLGSVAAAKISDAHDHTLKQVFKRLRRAVNLTCLHLQGEVVYPLGAALCGWTRPENLDAGVDQEDRPPEWYGFEEFGDINWMTATGTQDHSVDPSPSVSGNVVGARRPSFAMLFPRLLALSISKADFPISGPEDQEKTYRFKPTMWDLFKNRIPYGLDVKSLLKSFHLRSVAGASQVIRMNLVDCQCVEKEQIAPLIDTIPEVVWNGTHLTTQALRVAQGLF